MTRQYSPSSRVLAASGIALAIGAVTFLILWFTAPKPVSVQSAAAKAGVTEFTLPRGGSLTGSLRAEPRSFNPYLAEGEPHDAIALLTQARLVRINRSTDETEPWLAESWTVASDNVTCTFKLRPNILWSDGAPFTAADVVFSFRAWSQQIGDRLPPARAIDPLTVEITLPFAAGLRMLDILPMLPRHKLEQALENGTFARTWGPTTSPSEIVGLGPFVIAEYKAGERLTFSRNPHYWRKAEDGAQRPLLDRLILEIVPDGNVELQRLEDGQLDFSESEINAEDYAKLRGAEKQGKVRLYDLGPRLDADALWFNLAGPARPARPWLASEDFRLAISAAVDRRGFCDAVFPGGCDPIAGPITTGNPRWFMADLPAGEHDAERARAMLGSLGLLDRNDDGILDDTAGRPVRFTILVRQGLSTAERGAAFIRDELRKIGVAVDITALDPAAIVARWQNGEYEAIFDRIAAQDTDPAMNLDFWLSSGGTHPWNPRQTKPATEWEGQIDELMQKQVRTVDRVERLQLFAQVQRIFAQHMPAMYFGAPYIYVATGPRVLNATPSRQRPALLWNAEALAAIPASR